MRSSTILFLFALCSSAVATGHLRLEFTASNNCDLLLITDFSAQTISLRMGETRTSSFHPRNEETVIPVAFSIGNSAPKNKTYQLELSEMPQRDVFAFSEVAVLVQSIYECDTGYYGPLCTIKTNPNAPVSISSTSSTTLTTTTTTTTVTSTSMAEVSPNTFPVSVTALPLKNETPLTDIVIVVLTIVIVCLLILIIFVCIFLLPRQQHIYIEPTIETPELKKKKQLNDSYKCDSGFQSPESIRYTAAPFTSVTMSP